MVSRIVPLPSLPQVCVLHPHGSGSGLGVTAFVSWMKHGGSCGVKRRSPSLLTKPMNSTPKLSIVHENVALQLEFYHVR
jgi:hypothetical protein